MSINGVRHSPGGALPTAHEAPGGLTRTPHAGSGMVQHAALEARAPRRDGAGTQAPRAALGLLSQTVGHRLGGATANKADVFKQIANGEISLRGTYPSDNLAKAVGAAVNGLAGLMKSFPGLL